MICQPNCCSGAQIKTRGWNAGSEWGSEPEATTWQLPDATGHLFPEQALGPSQARPRPGQLSPSLSQSSTQAKWEEEKQPASRAQLPLPQPGRVSSSAQPDFCPCETGILFKNRGKKYQMKGNGFRNPSKKAWSG